MADMDARQFDGTFGCARAISDWVGDWNRCVYGAQPGTEDHEEAGLNLVTPEPYLDEQGEAVVSVHYHDVPKGHWVVKAPDGRIVAFSDEQYALAFGG